MLKQKSIFPRIQFNFEDFLSYRPQFHFRCFYGLTHMSDENNFTALSLNGRHKIHGLSKLHEACEGKDRRDSSFFSLRQLGSSSVGSNLAAVKLSDYHGK